MDKRTLRLTLLSAALLMPGLANAHTGLGDAHGFTHGFTHPIGGLDHILAMVMVGLFASLLGGRARWLVPASFVSVMVLGGLVGFAGLNMPFVELGIGLSIVVLGGVVAFNLQASTAVGMALVGFFAIFHGYAHGAEMPSGVSGLSYGAGFALATALLHLSGLGVGAFFAKMNGQQTSWIVRASGGVAALAGAGMVAGLI